jgi:hypothetical protein
MPFEFVERDVFRLSCDILGFDTQKFALYAQTRPFFPICPDGHNHKLAFPVVRYECRLTRGNASIGDFAIIISQLGR